MGLMRRPHWRQSKKNTWVSCILIARKTTYGQKPGPAGRGELIDPLGMKM